METTRRDCPICAALARNARVLAQRDDAEEKRLQAKHGKDEPIPASEARDKDGRHLGIRYRRPPDIDN